MHATPVGSAAHPHGVACHHAMQWPPIPMPWPPKPPRNAIALVVMVAAPIAKAAVGAKSPSAWDSPANLDHGMQTIPILLDSSQMY